MTLKVKASVTQSILLKSGATLMGVAWAAFGTAAGGRRDALDLVTGTLTEETPIHVRFV